MRSWLLLAVVLVLSLAVYVVMGRAPGEAGTTQLADGALGVPALVPSVPESEAKAEGGRVRGLPDLEPDTPAERLAAAPAVDPLFGAFELVDEFAEGSTVVVQHADTGEPLAGALVRAIPMSSAVGARFESLGRTGMPVFDLLQTQSLAARTDLDGHVRVRTDPRGTLLLVQARDAGGPMEFLGMLGPRFPRPLVARLGRLRTVEVSVRDESGAAVAGALVVGSCRRWHARREEVQRLVSRRTDSGGHVTLWVHSDAGRLGFGDELLGHDFSVGLEVLGGEDLAATPVWDGQGHGVVSLVVPGTGELAVRVEDAADRAVAGVDLVLSTAESGETLFEHRLTEAEAEAPGGYVLPLVALDREFELELRASRSRSPLHKTFAGPTEPGERVAIAMRLARVEPALRGRAVDGGGRPLAQLALTFGVRERRFVRTDAEGRFALDAAWLDVKAVFMKALFEDGDSAHRVLSLDMPDLIDPRDPWIDLGDVVFEHSPLLVAGDLGDLAGEPVVGQVGGVTYDGDPANGGRYLETLVVASPTDARGHFRMRGSQCNQEGARWLLLVAFGEGALAEEAISVPAGTDELEITLAPAATVSFRLEGIPSSLSGCLEAELVALDAPASDEGRSFPGRTSVGRLSWIGPMPLGRYRLVVRPDEHDFVDAITWSRELDLEPGLNDLGGLDEALDLHVYEIEFDPPPEGVGSAPDFLVARTPDGSGKLVRSGHGKRTGPNTWTLLSIGPATEVQFRLGAERRTWPLEEPRMRVRL
jgi:hypothetical protein